MKNLRNGNLGLNSTHIFGLIFQSWFSNVEYNKQAWDDWLSTWERVYINDGVDTLLRSMKELTYFFHSLL